MNLRALFFYQSPPWLWAMGIFIGSSIPAHYLPEFVILSPDKLLHIGVFFVFTVLVYRAIRFQKNDSSPEHFVRATLLISVGYGAFDELHQYFVPGRAPDPFDILADIIGVGIGLLAIKIVQIIMMKREKRIQTNDQHSTSS